MKKHRADEGGDIPSRHKMGWDQAESLAERLAAGGQFQPVGEDIREDEGDGYERHVLYYGCNPETFPRQSLVDREGRRDTLP